MGEFFREDLKTILFEKNDYASGASSKTGKLIHGGLRYLKHAQFKLVFVSCLERHRMLNVIAPHIVRPCRFVFPFFKSSKHSLWFVALLLFCYDLLSFFRNISTFKAISRDSLVEMEPTLLSKESKGALSYYDCTALDTRLTIDTLKSAVSQGAQVFSYTKVNNIRFVSEGVAIKIYDRIDQKYYQIKSQTVVNATGVWADDLMKMAKLEKKFNLKMTSGIHLIFKNKKVPINNPVVLEAVKDNRFLYIVPWENFTILGTTDRFYDGDKDNLFIRKDEVDYLLATINYYFPSLKLSLKDIVNITTGIRSLVGNSMEKSETQISRDYQIMVNHRGMLSVTGGKLTTYRHIAQKTVDKLVKEFFKDKKIKACSTISPISGADIRTIDMKKLLEIYSVDEPTLDRLLWRYGSNALAILEIAEKDKNKYNKINDDLSYIWGELHYIIENEHAEKLADVLCRRTLISLTNPIPEQNTLNKIASFMGDMNGWNKQRIKEEIDHYISIVTYNRMQTQIGANSIADRAGRHTKRLEPETDG